MGELKPASWYNGIYAKRALKKPTQYFPPWPEYSCLNLRLPEVVALIGERDNVLDLGCGPGLLACALWHNGHAGRYTGVDFSTVQLDLASKGNKESGHQLAQWILCDIAKDTTALDGEYDVVVMMELLEHLELDLDIVRRIRPGARVVITVPTKDDPSHVRVFDETGHSAIERYGRFLDNLTHKTICKNNVVRYHLLSGVAL